MNASQFKKIANLLTDIYREIKKESLQNGIDILSPEYEQLRTTAREMLLKNMGFTVQQYQEAKARAEAFTQADMLDFAEKLKADIAGELNDLVIPTREEIISLAHEVAKTYIQPPQITNQIVRETTIEKPQIIKETTIEKTVQEVAFNDADIRKSIDGLSEQMRSLPLPVTPEQITEITKQFFKDNFADNFQKNIDVFGMPDFRKLAMGIREDLDTKITGIYTHKITVSATEPTGPQLNDLWVDTT